MKFYSLASGSKGNCFVILDQDVQIEIDCGSTQRYLKQCFEQIQVDYLKTDGLLLTHSHIDHISQLKMFRHALIYTPFSIDKEYRTQTVIPFESFYIRHMKITPLPLSHDTEITVGYIFDNGKERLVYITDTGYVRQDYYELLKNADYYIMESNHDIPMLMNTQRPYSLKSRILSDMGHLSNEACAELLSVLVGENTKEILLAHISEEANTEELALQTIRKNMRQYQPLIKAGKQRQITEGGTL